MRAVEVLTNESGRVDLYLPFHKVDEDRRLVSGFATLDNVDHHGDIVTAEASEAAFAAFRGNIREMHMPVAVGKMVDFAVKSLYDDESDREYKGIWVTVKVSKGAQDTWEKVLDGTLSGFSIGGNIVEKSIVIEDDGSEHRVINKYNLMELSLVDSPANPLANVFSIEKVEGGYMVKGMVTDVTEEELQEMEVEKSAEVTESKVNLLLDTIVDSLTARFSQIVKGGNTDMATETIEEVEAIDEAPEVEAPVDEIVEKAAEVSEVEDAPEAETLDTDVIVDAVVEKVLERLNESGEADSAEVEANDEAPVEKSNEAEELIKSLTAKLDESVKAISESVEALSTRIESLEDATAVKKSGDISNDDDETMQKSQSIWGGKFVNGNYLSADEL